MILLPNIRIGGNILSIQEPFTLNGYLVVDIDVDINELTCRCPYTTIAIRNEYGYCIRYSSEEIEHYFKGNMYEFISIYGNRAHVEGRRDLPDWSDYSISKYIKDIKAQCDRIRDYRYYGSTNTNSYLNALKADLRRQGREHIEPMLLSYDWGNLRNLSFSTGLNFGDTSSNTYKYIHSYNYKPEYISHYISDEDPNTTLLLGCEIEIDHGGESEDHAKKVLEIICGIDPENNDKVLENKMYCMHDGSLTNGFECTTMPCSLEYHKKEMKYKEMFEYLDKNGYKAHDTTTCGLHVHADRKYLGKSELVQQLTISKILYILEKFNDEICVIARRDNRYSPFVGSGKNEKSVVELYNKYKNQDKYVALNLKHDASIEFRMFKGTLKYETFILTLEFVKDIIDFAKSINIEEIELAKWSDLMNTFSNELKEYYNNRLNKENKKKDKKEETSYRTIGTGAVIRNDHAGYIDADIIAAARGSRSNIAISNEIYNSMYRDLMQCIQGDSYSNSISLDSLGNANSNVLSREKTKLDTLKDKEKTLKKQIKNSNNFMEKKVLKKELNEIQKELKKEKKRIKLNNNNNTNTDNEER